MSNPKMMSPNPMHTMERDRGRRLSASGSQATANMTAPRPNRNRMYGSINRRSSVLCPFVGPQTEKNPGGKTGLFILHRIVGEIRYLDNSELREGFRRHRSDVYLLLNELFAWVIVFVAPARALRR
jgi:hypothetical protein